MFSFQTGGKTRYTRNVGILHLSLVKQSKKVYVKKKYLEKNEGEGRKKKEGLW